MHGELSCPCVWWLWTAVKWSLARCDSSCRRNTCGFFQVLVQAYRQRYMTRCRNCAVLLCLAVGLMGELRWHHSGCGLSVQLPEDAHGFTVYDLGHGTRAVSRWTLGFQGLCAMGWLFASCVVHADYFRCPMEAIHKAVGCRMMCPCERHLYYT